MRPLSKAPGYVACTLCGAWYKSHGDRGLGNAYEVAWVDRKSKWYLLGEMETSHIQNIIAIMLVRPDWRESYREIMINELEKRLREEDYTNGTPT